MVTERMLQAVGTAVANVLPLIITRGGAMTKEAFNNVNSDISKGTAFDQVAANLAEARNTIYWSTALQYTAVLNRRHRIMVAWKSTSLHARNENVTFHQPPHFSSIDQKVCLYVNIESSQYPPIYYNVSINDCFRARL